MINSVILRAANAGDALCLGVLGMHVFLDNYCPAGIRPTVAREVLAAFSTETMAALLARPQTQVIVAESDGHLVGFAQITLGTAQELVVAQNPVELDRLYVQEPFTARGVGSRLIRQAEQQAAAAGADVMWLSPWVHNHRALRFYVKHHYEDLGLTWYRFEGEQHENRVLAKALGSADG